MHRTLTRQLRKLALGVDRAPPLAEWQALLQAVSTSYREADEGIYLVERSLHIASREMSELHASEAQRLEGWLQAVIGAMPDLLFLIDDRGCCIEVVGGDRGGMPVPPGCVRGRCLGELLPRRLSGRLRRAIRNAIVSGDLQMVEYRLPCGDGRNRVFEGRVVPTGYQVGGRDTVMFLARDVTLQKQSSRTARLLEIVIKAAHDGVVVVDRQHRVLYANPAIERITGYSLQDLTAQGSGFLRHQLDRPLCERICAEAERTSHFQDEIEIHTRSGDTRLVWLNIDTLRNGHDETDYYVAILNDVTDIQRSRAELQRVATRDALTDLPNRALFEERLQQALSRARRQHGLGALLLLDLDRFKQINDTLGHAVGDRMLVEVAGRLQHSIRVEDTAARLGGDEFTVILEDVESLDHVMRVADKIIDSIGLPMAVEGLALEISTSVGIATFSERGQTIGELLKQADSAMYDAKAAGGNQYRFHNPLLSQTALNNISIQAALRAALNNRELVVYYQPQIEVASGRMKGLEALLRWPQHDGSMRQPCEFIGVAEVSGLIEPLGLWVIEEVCRQAAAWRSTGLEYTSLSLNVSGRQLVNPGFPGQVEQILQRYGIPGSDLEIEITESTVINEGDIRHRNLDRLHALGISLAIDDFGTGHSSLVNLKRFPLNRLKVDRSFIRDVGSDPNDEAIVGATVALARQLGLGVVAEGVETGQQLAFLNGLGCELVQGFLFERPMTAAQVAARYGRA